jgi:hypothetical protein
VESAVFAGKVSEGILSITVKNPHVEKTAKVFRFDEENPDLPWVERR